MFKHQLSCLSTATIRLAVFHGEHAFAINTHVIYAFELWLQKDERQRVLWPSIMGFLHISPKTIIPKSSMLFSRGFITCCSDSLLGKKCERYSPSSER